MTYPEGPVTMADPTYTPGESEGGNAPAIRELVGRTIALIPTSANPSAIYKGQPRPSIKANVYILDGPELHYGAGASPPTPARWRTQVPTYIEGMFLQGPVVGKLHEGEQGPLSPYIGTGTPVAGRFIVSTTTGNQSFLFAKLGGETDPRKAERDQLWAALVNLIESHRKRLWVPPQPVALFSAAPAGATGIPQVSYGQQPAVPQVPQVPKVPQVPARPWRPVLAGHGWTPEVWASEAPKMSEETYAYWSTVA